MFKTFRINEPHQLQFRVFFNLFNRVNLGRTWWSAMPHSAGSPRPAIRASSSWRCGTVSSSSVEEVVLRSQEGAWKMAQNALVFNFWRVSMDNSASKPPFRRCFYSRLPRSWLTGQAGSPRPWLSRGGRAEFLNKLPGPEAMRKSGSEFRAIIISVRMGNSGSDGASQGQNQTKPGRERGGDALKDTLRDEAI